MKALKGTYDGEQIQLEEDVKLKKDSKLLVILLDEEDEWTDVSAKSINRAYEEDEPEYKLSMVKEPNPAYESQ
ncbi:hypothetical protein [Gracilimonas mengyeensis]|uniref:Uncharacterized protein n=1 Tax=Gracilimonas mengyeensis TaxID=1302730 RepID=A0A521E398_9BACT|nr:hypothetical protein [Gracilimonas mengyeensis]SMO78429.1 hypothetical protein SAMN06265219_110117 [Gracilimonas mengyeensis]